MALPLRRVFPPAMHAVLQVVAGEFPRDDTFRLVRGYELFTDVVSVWVQVPGWRL